MNGLTGAANPPEQTAKQVIFCEFLHVVQAPPRCTDPRSRNNCKLQCSRGHCCGCLLRGCFCLQPAVADGVAEPAPFLEHAELPGSYHHAHPPIRPDQPSPEPPAALPRPPLSAPPAPQLATEPPPQPKPTAPVAAAAIPAAPANSNGGTHGSVAAGGGGALQVPSSAPAEEDGSGTDTDEDGELIAKARQKALLERQRAAVAKKRGPGTGDPQGLCCVMQRVPAGGGFESLCASGSLTLPPIRPKG